jgi:hypothetical protein
VVGDPARAVIPQDNLAGRVAADALQMAAEGFGPGLAAKGIKAGAELGMAGGRALAKAPGEIARGLVQSEARPGAAEAIKEGYALPPRLAQVEPTATGSGLSGLGGKVKLQQDFSTANQLATNKIAASELGLPIDQPITQEALKKIRSEAGKAYEAPKEVLGFMSPKTDQKFTSDILQAANRQAGLQKRYPVSSATNPQIVKLQKELLKGKMSADDAIELTKRYRQDATKNLKSWEDPDKRELGIFQRKAANALEEMIGRNLQNTEGNLTSQMTNLVKERARLSAAVEKEKTVVSRLVKESESEFKIGNADLKKAEVKVREMKKRLSEIGSIGENASGELADTAAKLAKAKEIGQPRVAEMLKDWQAARKKIAMSHAVETALNEDAGEVSAKVLASMKNKGVPLSGGLDTIASSYNRFSPVMKSPAQFGYPEKLSYLDVLSAGLGGIGALSGHPAALAAAALPLARPAARSLLLSPKYQKLMVRQ